MDVIVFWTVYYVNILFTIGKFCVYYIANNRFLNKVYFIIYLLRKILWWLDSFSYANLSIIHVFSNIKTLRSHWCSIFRVKNVTYLKKKYLIALYFRLIVYRICSIPKKCEGVNSDIIYVFNKILIPTIHAPMNPSSSYTKCFPIFFFGFLKNFIARSLRRMYIKT